MNVIGNFCLQFLNIHEATANLEHKSQAEWNQAYGTKLNEVVQGFNSMTSSDWNERIKAEQAAFEEYSRD